MNDVYEVHTNVGYADEILEVEYDYEPAYSETTEYCGMLRTDRYEARYTIMDYRQVGMKGVCPLLDVCEQELLEWINN